MADDLKTDEAAECELPPSKRKSDSNLIDTADDQSKKSKTEIQSVTSPLQDDVTVNGDVDDDDGNEEEENLSGEAEAVVDRKGKGIMTRDDKGKGKMVEEDEDESDDDVVVGGGEGDGEDGEDDDDSSDDDDDDSGDEDDDSDLSDDPLAEVDLDNILPSRTRRRAASSGGISLGRRGD